LGFHEGQMRVYLPGFEVGHVRHGVAFIAQDANAGDAATEDAGGLFAGDPFFIFHAVDDVFDNRQDMLDLRRFDFLKGRVGHCGPCVGVWR